MKQKTFYFLVAFVSIFLVALLIFQIVPFTGAVTLPTSSTTTTDEKCRLANPGTATNNDKVVHWDKTGGDIKCPVDQDTHCIDARKAPEVILTCAIAQLRCPKGCVGITIYDRKYPRCDQRQRVVGTDKAGDPVYQFGTFAGCTINCRVGCVPVF